MHKILICEADPFVAESDFIREGCARFFKKFQNIFHGPYFPDSGSALDRRLTRQTRNRMVELLYETLIKL
jgi:hypothetical protein